MICNQSFHRTSGDRPQTDSQIKRDLLQYILIIPGYRTYQVDRQFKIIVLFHIPGKKSQKTTGNQLPDSRFIQMLPEKILPENG